MSDTRTQCERCFMYGGHWHDCPNNPSRLEAAEDEAREMDDNDVLQVLCRAFDNWEPIYEEWLSWYDPKDWFHRARGFGAFMRKVLNERNVDDEKRELLASVTARYEAIGKLNAENAALRSENARMAEENERLSHQLNAYITRAVEEDYD